MKPPDVSTCITPSNVIIDMMIIFLIDLFLYYFLIMIIDTFILLYLPLEHPTLWRLKSAGSPLERASQLRHFLTGGEGGHTILVLPLGLDAKWIQVYCHIERHPLRWQPQYPLARPPRVSCCIFFVPVGGGERVLAQSPKYPNRCPY